MSVLQTWLGNPISLPPGRHGQHPEAFEGTEGDGSGQHGCIPMSPISLVTRHLVARGPADSQHVGNLVRAVGGVP